MVARAQEQAFKKGTLAAIERTKDRKKTIIEIDHSPTVPSQSLLKGVMHWLAASGAVNMQTTSISLGDDVGLLQNALQRSEEMVEQYRQRLAEAQQKLEMLRQGEVKWISLKDAADLHKVDYSTMWRAQAKGRLKTIVIGGDKKNQYLCDPTTYVPAPRKLKKDKSK